jgi:Ni/Co efflux regulator RcnB
MVRRRIVFASLLTAAVLVPAVGFAQPHGDHGRGRGHAYGHDRVERADDIPPRWADQPHRDWHKGDRLPPEFRDRQYVVDEWRGYRLSPPPRGYHWVGVGGDYLLVQIGSGLVLRVGP